MTTEIKPRQFSYILFLDELNFILESSGIIPGRSPVMADYSRRKSWYSPSDRKIKQKIGRVIFFMDEHLADELTLEELAREVDLSKYQLIRRFREQEGTTPWKFLIRKRIEKVKELLEKGMSPGQAAVEAGFYDQSHMNKVFLNETGSTPKEYQEENFKNRN